MEEGTEVRDGSSGRKFGTEVRSRAQLNPKLMTDRLVFLTVNTPPRAFIHCAIIAVDGELTKGSWTFPSGYKSTT